MAPPRHPFSDIFMNPTWTLLLLPFAGVWFDLFVALFLLYGRLDEAFSIEKSIAAAYPGQARHPET